MHRDTRKSAAFVLGSALLDNCVSLNFTIIFIVRKVVQLIPLSFIIVGLLTTLTTRIITPTNNNHVNCNSYSSSVDNFFFVQSFSITTSSNKNNLIHPRITKTTKGTRTLHFRKPSQQPHRNNVLNSLLLLPSSSSPSSSSLFLASWTPLSSSPTQDHQQKQQQDDEGKDANNNDYSNIMPPISKGKKRQKRSFLYDNSNNNNDYDDSNNQVSKKKKKRRKPQYYWNNINNLRYELSQFWEDAFELYSPNSNNDDTNATTSTNSYDGDNASSRNGNKQLDVFAPSKEEDNDSRLLLQKLNGNNINIDNSNDNSSSNNNINILWIPNETLLNYFNRHDLRGAIRYHGGRKILCKQLNFELRQQMQLQQQQQQQQSIDTITNDKNDDSSKKKKKSKRTKKIKNSSYKTLTNNTTNIIQVVGIMPGKWIDAVRICKQLKELILLQQQHQQRCKIEIDDIENEILSFDHPPLSPQQKQILKKKLMVDNENNHDSTLNGIGSTNQKKSQKKKIGRRKRKQVNATLSYQAADQEEFHSNGEDDTYFDNEREENIDKDSNDYSPYDKKEKKKSGKWSHQNGRRPKGYWSLQLIIQEVYEYLDDYQYEYNRPSTFMPQLSELDNNGRQDLQQAITRYGGYKRIAKLAGLVPYREWYYFEGQFELFYLLQRYHIFKMKAKMKSKARLNNNNNNTATNNNHHNNTSNNDMDVNVAMMTTFPSVSEIRRTSGYERLYQLIQYYGGRKFLASRLGMKYYHLINDDDDDDDDNNYNNENNTKEIDNYIDIDKNDSNDSSNNNNSTMSSGVNGNNDSDNDSLQKQQRRQKNLTIVTQNHYFCYGPTLDLDFILRLLQWIRNDHYYYKTPPLKNPVLSMPSKFQLLSLSSTGATATTAGGTRITTAAGSTAATATATKNIQNIMQYRIARRIDHYNHLNNRNRKDNNNSTADENNSSTGASRNINSTSKQKEDAIAYATRIVKQEAEEGKRLHEEIMMYGGYENIARRLGLAF